MVRVQTMKPWPAVKANVYRKQHRKTHQHIFSTTAKKPPKDKKKKKKKHGQNPVCKGKIFGDLSSARGWN